jgi:DNA-binding LacI/PurR family transcriptional regulator
MPGVIRLADELGVARNTVVGALKVLEREGLLVAQGHGRGRMIDAMGAEREASDFRVGILQYEAADRALPYMIELQHRLEEAGHVAVFARKTLLDLGRDAERVAAFVKGVDADAWVVVGGSREILEWFAARPVPVFALFGRRRSVRIASAGPDKVKPLRGLVRRLAELGHRRIVLLSRGERRKPQPGAVEQAFLDELAAQGISPGPFHLPDWEENVDGFHERLGQLFKISAPSALILDEVPFFVAALDFCASRGIRVPHDLSLVCMDASPDFDWCLPKVAHIRWESGPVVRRIVNWAENVSRGKTDRRQTMTPAEFVVGGTIGAVREEDRGSWIVDPG